MIMGKSAIKESDLLIRSINKIPLELQLFSDFDTKSTDELLKTIAKIPNVNVQHIHTPLREADNIHIDLLDVPEVKQDIDKTVALAGALSSLFGHKITVVMHLDADSKVILENPTKYNYLISVFEKYISVCPNLDFAIENVMMFKRDYSYCTNVYNESIPLINKLNAYFGEEHKYFGTTLDLCHAESTIRSFERIFEGYPEMRRLTMDDYFREHKDVVKVIHFSTLQNMGFRKEEQGIAFRTAADMKPYVDLYKKYNYDCNVVLEIQESDYATATNLFVNYKMLKGLMS